MTMSGGVDLNAVWFFLIGFFLMGYAILDGFDLGVGMLHLFARTEEDRRAMLSAIAPVWDGNEVWLIAAGGSLFAVFPSVYAVIMSGFYPALYLFLFSLVLRAVAVELRGKESMPWWRYGWDVCFGISSFFASFCVGVIVGNLMCGVPVNAEGIYAGSLCAVFHPQTLGMGVAMVFLFMMHGGIYMALKTEGSLRGKASRWVERCTFFFIIVYAVTMGGILASVPYVRNIFLKNPALAAAFFIAVIALARIPANIKAGREKVAFGLSSGFIIVWMFQWGMAVFPDMIVSSLDQGYSLSVYNAASAPKTLAIMLALFAGGMPLVVGYTIYVYRVFKGRVPLGGARY